jgi:hypothetical protein
MANVIMAYQQLNTGVMWKRGENINEKISSNAIISNGVNNIIKLINQMWKYQCNRERKWKHQYQSIIQYINENQSKENEEMKEEAWK